VLAKSDELQLESFLIITKIRIYEMGENSVLILKRVESPGTHDNELGGWVGFLKLKH
jgi:hypothetical protein